MKVFLVALLAAAVAANSPAYKPSYPAEAYPVAPAYPAAPASYQKPSASYSKSYDYAPMPYNFAWAMKDDNSYNDYAHQETSDDKGYVTGSYRVLLPDGRTQIVTYKADDYTGYVADVRYEGIAKYDDYKPAYKPAYKPEYKPAYPAAPAYPPANYPAPAAKYPAPAYEPAYKPAYPAAPTYPAAQYSTYPTTKYPTRF